MRIVIARIRILTNTKRFYSDGFLYTTCHNGALLVFLLLPEQLPFDRSRVPGCLHPIVDLIDEPKSGKAFDRVVVHVVPLQDRLLEVQRISDDRNDGIALGLAAEVLLAQSNDDDHGHDDAEEEQGDAQAGAHVRHDFDQVEIHLRPSSEGITCLTDRTLAKVLT